MAVDAIVQSFPFSVININLFDSYPFNFHGSHKFTNNIIPVRLIKPPLSNTLKNCT